MFCRSNRRFGAWLFCCLSVLLLVFAATAYAGPAGTKPSTTPASQPAPKAPPHPAFPLSEVETEAESTSITLRTIDGLLNNDRELSDIEQDSPILSREIDNRLEESSSILASNPSLQLLANQLYDWTTIQHTLDGWKRTLKQRADRLEQADDQIKHVADTWNREKAVLDYWLKHAKSTELLGDAKEAIESTVAKINYSSDDLHRARIRLFAVEEDLDAQSARVLDVLDSVNQARDEAFDRLLQRDSPLLWSLFGAQNTGASFAAQGQESLRRQLGEVRNYLKQQIERVAGQIAIFIVLAFVLSWIHRRVENWCEKEPGLRDSTRVFASPIATALVLSLLLTDAIFPRAPRLLWAIIEAAALVPTVIILRRLIDRRWFIALNALVAFYFLDQVRLIGAALPLLVRVVLLVEMLGSALLLLAIIRQGRRAENEHKIARFVRFLGFLWMLIFLLAAIADVIGYVSLANLIGNASLASAYIAVVVYACVRVVSGFLTIAMHTHFLSRLRLIREHKQLIIRRLNLLLIWIASIFWVWSVLSYLSLGAVAWNLGHRVLIATFTYGQISVSLENVLVFAFTIWLSVQISRFLRFVLEQDIYDRFELPRGISYAISKMINYVIVLIGFFIAVSALGYDLTKFTILAGAFGVGLGFGLQNIINNFVSGLILLFERPVKVGDVIQMGDTTGTVGHIGIRASIIRTLDSAEIIVPNGNLISNQVTNWTLSNHLRGLEIKIALGSTTKPSDLIELLTKTAAAQNTIVNNPPPEAFLTDLSADAFHYELHAWTNAAEKWIQVRSNLVVAIHDALAERQIPIR
jgi:potassium-dependent mechanosensitive channel